MRYETNVIGIIITECQSSFLKTRSKMATLYILCIVQRLNAINNALLQNLIDLSINTLKVYDCLHKYHIGTSRLRSKRIRFISN
jgi:hypothetical protein